MMNPKDHTPRDIIIETSKVKRQGENLKGRKKNKLAHKRTPIRL